MTGDFNLPNPLERRRFCADVAESGLDQLIASATHRRGGVLDLIFAPDRFFSDVAVKFTVASVDHCTIFADLNSAMELSASGCAVVLTTFDVARTDKAAFAKKYDELVAEIYDSMSFDEQWHVLINSLLIALHYGCPVKNVSTCRRVKKSRPLRCKCKSASAIKSSPPPFSSDLIQLLMTRWLSRCSFD